MRLEESSLLLRVRPNDLDSLGHVNNAIALEYLEAGRWAWMDLHSLRRGGGIIAVTLRIEVDYKREIAPQEVVVRTRLEEPLAEEVQDVDAIHYRARFHQQILVDSGRTVAVEARVQAAFVSTEDRAVRSVQEFLASARQPAS
ncbi:acyl-CoA thioester hydrolase [Stigmatella aurantiaca]|uniref:Acyl-CoA thioester hydrolase n=1 Tax=Stigmatella aurantiaca TaxID=41 RepID=A0A1H7YMC2_STIAU|nr:acyl-CoA thioesterase [Stigmatella aurantiaca]SEM47382.1 acyl-CoA thioester hydrolase [Stigmatella aurantiaca]